MKDQTEILQQVLEKYLFVEPASSESRLHIQINRRKSLKSSLKKLHRYNPFFGLVILFFFISHRLGVGLSMGQSVIASFLAVTVSIGAVSAGSYYTVKTIIDKTRVIQKKKHTEAEKKNDEVTVNEQKHPGIVKDDFIILDKINPIGVSGKKADIISGIFKQNLSTELRPMKLTMHADAGKILKTQLIYSGDIYSLHVSIVMADGSIIFTRSYEEPSLEKLSERTSEIAKDVGQKVR